MDICPWDSIPGKEPKVVVCIFGMESSSAKNPMTPHSNVGDDLPGKVCGVRPLEELTRGNPRRRNMARRKNGNTASIHYWNG